MDKICLDEVTQQWIFIDLEIFQKVPPHFTFRIALQTAAKFLLRRTSLRFTPRAFQVFRSLAAEHIQGESTDMDIVSLRAKLDEANAVDATHGVAGTTDSEWEGVPATAQERLSAGCILAAQARPYVLPSCARIVQSACIMFRLDVL